MSDSDLHYQSLSDISLSIQAGSLTSVAATQAQLDRIAALDGGLGSYTTVMAAQALADAARADAEIAAGEIRGPLHGVPVAVKDLCWTHDAPTAHGMTILRDHQPTEDGTVVRRLREAGAVILGKLQMTEGAYADHHPEVRPPLNAWGQDRWPGASSSGSGAATAAGLCYGSIGTDTGGSIRFPSAANGVTGLKPTWGRVSRYGAFVLGASLDHIGPMARSARDTALMLQVMAGPDPKDPTAADEPVPDYVAALDQGVTGLRIGIDHAWYDLADAETAEMLAHVIATVQTLGAEVVEVTVPNGDAMLADWFPLCGVEAAAAHQAWYPARKADYGPALSGIIELGLQQTALDMHGIEMRRRAYGSQLKSLFNQIDLLIAPVTGFASPTVEKMTTLGTDDQLMNGLLRYTCPFDMSGSPTLTLPGGFTKAGTPIGFQFVGRHFDEAIILRAGHAFQSVTDWHQRHPAL